MDMYLTGVVVAVATTDPIDAAASFSIRECLDVAISIKNTGANALDAFQIKGRAHSSLPWTLLLSVTGDYTTPKYPLQRATTDPTSLAAGADSILFLKAGGLRELQFLASSATGTTTVDIGVHGT